MKRIILITTILFLFAVPAHSALDLLGQGTSAHGTYNLIYDTDLDITWYDYSNSFDTWDNQVAWASGLSVDFGVNIYNNWRLPSTDDITLPEPAGFDITSSEMGHLYYTELGNTAGGFTNSGDFQNLVSSRYWSGTEYAPTPSEAWNFSIGSGYQHNDDKPYSFSALAVMSGRAIVPEPISSILFLTGGGVLAGRRYFRRKQ